METCLKDSFVDFLPCPSASFAGMDTAARCTWLLKPWVSDFGKDRASTQICRANCIPSCHTFKS